MAARCSGNWTWASSQPKNCTPSIFCSLLLFLSRGHSVAGVLVCVRKIAVSLFLSQSRDADLVEEPSTVVRREAASPGPINNHKWHVPSVLCPQLHWAYFFFFFCAVAFNQGGLFLHTGARRSVGSLEEKLRGALTPTSLISARLMMRPKFCKCSQLQLQATILKKK